MKSKATQIIKKNLLSSKIIDKVANNKVVENLSKTISRTAPNSVAKQEKEGYNIKNTSKIFQILTLIEFSGSPTINSITTITYQKKKILIKIIIQDFSRKFPLFDFMNLSRWLIFL